MTDLGQLLNTDFLNLPLMGAAGLLLASAIAAVFSARLGLSFLLVFLVGGMLAGEDGPGGFQFDDHRLSFWWATWHWPSSCWTVVCAPGWPRFAQASDPRCGWPPQVYWPARC